MPAITKTRPTAQMLARSVTAKCTRTELDPDLSDAERGLFTHKYENVVTNESDEVLQLLGRAYEITDERKTSTFNARSVVGYRPLLKPSQSFSWVSGVPLTTPEGMMEGSILLARPVDIEPVSGAVEEEDFIRATLKPFPLHCS